MKAFCYKYIYIFFSDSLEQLQDKIENNRITYAPKHLLYSASDLSDIDNKGIDSTKDKNEEKSINNTCDILSNKLNEISNRVRC